VKQPASRFLLPISYLSILAGTCTLIGTSTNILVDSLYRQAGGPGFGMFEFSALGAVYVAIGGAYVHPRWHDAGLPRFEGWWGHAKDRRFLLEERFAGTGTAEAWQLSNPPIFAMAPLASSLDLFEEAGMDRLRAKSRLQAAYLEWLLEALCGERCSLLSPSASPMAASDCPKRS